MWLQRVRVWVERGGRYDKVCPELNLITRRNHAAIRLFSLLSPLSVPCPPVDDCAGLTVISQTELEKPDAKGDITNTKARLLDIT